jgi:HAD superfamily hydrolase (TIGR01490 family)
VEAAFFDLDKTVIARPSMVAFGRPLYREGLISRRTVLRMLWAQLIYLHLGADEERLARMREAVLTLTKGWERERIRSIVYDALEEIVEPIIFGEALELMAEHRAAGRRVVIVSASPEEIVAPLGTYLGVDGAIGSRPRVDAEGRYTGEMELYASGQAKAEAIRELARQWGIDLGASFAYSDSATDLPMLEAVGHPVVVNPDRALARIAREREWEVRAFVRPVRLRGERRSLPQRALLATGAVAASAAVGALAIVVVARARTRAPSHPPNPPPLEPARPRLGWAGRGAAGLRGRSLEEPGPGGLSSRGTASRPPRRGRRPLPAKEASSWARTLSRRERRVPAGRFGPLPAG